MRDTIEIELEARMAGFCQGPLNKRLSALIPMFWLLAGSGSVPCARGEGLYDRPVLVIDPDMHTAISRAGTDAAGRFFVTGSYDKTVRIWSASDGRLQRTIRVPSGPGFVGRIYAVAMSPEAEIVAAGGWTESDENNVIYLFERASGKLVKRIAGLSDVVLSLAYSRDGRYLAAGLGDGGLRVFDRDQSWSEVSRDTAYEDQIYGLSFAPDGRLAVSSLDGRIRLYDAQLKLLLTQRVSSGHQPMHIAFDPNGSALAVGYDYTTAVDILDGNTLERRPGADMKGRQAGSLQAVAWSADGQTLFASGGFRLALDRLVVAWDQGGRAEPRAFSARCAKDDQLTEDLVADPRGGLLVVKANPCLTLLNGSGQVLWTHGPPMADFRSQSQTFAASADGAVVDFGFEQFGVAPLRFDVRALKLSNGPPKDGLTIPPRQDEQRIQDWSGATDPKLDGKSLKLRQFERSLSLALHPDGSRFVLGADWTLRAFDMTGKELWTRANPGTAWAVNITADGRLVVATYSDGTIRWNRMDDGRELLALQVLSDKKNWVAWTPEGFYDATPGAFGVLKWHVNRGREAAADALPVSSIPRLKRPDALPLVLQELETARALGIADLAAARFDVKTVTGAVVAPGARLHVLSIGISDYGEKAKDLRLQFASKDANDVASALLATQAGEFNKLGGLYADVRPQYLSDEKADRAGIFAALDALKTNMASGAGQDFAVVMFSGHGVTLEDRFYLLPFGVDARTSAGIRASAISANEFHDEIEQVAKHGRVLVLLDACHSGAAAGDGSKLASNADLLRSLMSASNVTVLTSSTAGEVSREDQDWGNGAFTKVLMDAFGPDADENHDGVISMSELTRYVARQVPLLTGNSQHPGMDQRFEGGIFVASR
jgi:WD40 repeat protein